MRYSVSQHLSFRPGQVGADTKELYIASACDKVYVGPQATVAPLGFSMSVRYVKGALAKAEIFGRSALTGMHTWDDALFVASQQGIPTDGLDIVDLAPTILTLLGVEPPSDMDGRVRAGVEAAAPGGSLTGGRIERSDAPRR